MKTKAEYHAEKFRKNTRLKRTESCGCMNFHLRCILIGHKEWRQSGMTKNC